MIEFEPQLKIEQRIAYLTPLNEGLQNSRYKSLITEEIAAIQKTITSLGVENNIYTILLGSAAKGNLRTKEDDPEDPSDIDLLMIVSDGDMQKLSMRMQDGTRLSRSRTSVDATFYVVKRPSLSSKLAETEVMICSFQGLRRQLASTGHESQTQFVNDALREGFRVD